jgi:amidase
MDDDLCFTPATELRRLLADRALSARELLAAFLSRIDRVNPRLNAIVTLDEDGALERAAAADHAAARGELLGPLHGLPIGIKDLADTAGLRTTYGSPIFADHVPGEDSPHVALLRRAGAIVLGKTNTPEFGAGAQTFNEVFGVTRNPYDLNLTSGGSSGGAAAAVGAGLLPFADGSDLAASVRNPAAMCAVVGLRTTPGTVPYGRPGHDDVFDPQIVVGPLARTPADAALLLAGMRSAEEGRPYTRLAPPEPAGPQPLRVPAPERLRIAWSWDAGGLPVAREVRDVLTLARKQLTGANVVVDDAEPDLSGADDVFGVLRGLLVAASYGPLLETDRDRMKPALIWNIEQGQAVTGSQVAAAFRTRSAIFGRMRQFLTRYDVLALPTVQVPPFPTDVQWVQEIDGVPQETYLDWMRSCSRITVTAHPAVSVPAGFTPDGLPVGLQLVGRFGADRELLEVAAAVTAVLNPVTPRPPL